MLVKPADGAEILRVALVRERQMAKLVVDVAHGQVALRFLADHARVVGVKPRPDLAALEKHRVDHVERAL